jgi:hypothetical protein
MPNRSTGLQVYSSTAVPVYSSTAPQLHSFTALPALHFNSSSTSTAILYTIYGSTVYSSTAPLLQYHHGEPYAAVGLLMHVNGLGLSLVTDSVCDNDNDTFISCFLFAL